MTEQCRHYACLCARADELAAMDLTAEAVALLIDQPLVPCREVSLDILTTPDETRAT